jgi:hypothetical protein
MSDQSIEQEKLNVKDSQLFDNISDDEGEKFGLDKNWNIVKKRENSKSNDKNIEETIEHSGLEDET